MKPSDTFKTSIREYLDKRAATDELFAASYGKPTKNIDDCVTYILNTVKASGCNGFSDDEIFSMAVHYYDEGKINVGKPVQCKVVVNRSIELTEEEKEKARQDAIKKVEAEQIANLKAKPKKAKKAENTGVEQQSLF